LEACVDAAGRCHFGLQFIQEKTIKTQKFDDRHMQFGGNDKYGEWLFVYQSTSTGSVVTR
jgi:hypothetical protein